MTRPASVRQRATALGALTLILLLTACSSNSSTSPSASPTVDACASLKTLETSVDALLAVQPLQVGAQGVKTAVGEVQKDLDAAASVASTEFAPQIDALKQSVTAVSDTLQNTNGQSIATIAGQLATELPAIKTAWDNLKTAASSLDCGLQSPSM